MERISRNELVTFRLKKAGEALLILQNEIENLKKRLNLVEIHNDELQDLIEKISESAKAISASVSKSMEELKSDDNFVFDDSQSEEIEKAEELSQGSSDVDFDF